MQEILLAPIHIDIVIPIKTYLFDILEMGKLRILLS